MRRREPGTNRIYHMTQAAYHEAVLAGLNREVSLQRGSSRVETVYTDERCTQSEIILGPCMTLAGPLVEGEAMVHPDTAVTLSSLPSPEHGKPLVLATPEAGEETQTLEARIVGAHAEWMTQHAPGLRLLDTTQLITASAYADEILRRKLIDDMGSQMAVDAFKCGMAVIALSKPQYLVQEWMGAGSAYFPRVAHQQAPWTAEKPDPARLERDTMIAIKLEAYGFPLAVREV
jgi:hypothetical protein